MNDVVHQRPLSLQVLHVRIVAPVLQKLTWLQARQHLQRRPSYVSARTRCFMALSVLLRVSMQRNTLPKAPRPGCARDAVTDTWSPGIRGAHNKPSSWRTRYRSASYSGARTLHDHGRRVAVKMGGGMTPELRADGVAPALRGSGQRTSVVLSSHRQPVAARVPSVPSTIVTDTSPTEAIRPLSPHSCDQPWEQHVASLGRALASRRSISARPTFGSGS